jgi:hypothetical protein
MKYLLIIHANPSLADTLSEDEINDLVAAHDTFQERIRDTGELVGYAALADPTMSRTVRVRDGQRVVSDGPYAEVKEFLAGYYLIDADTPERATEIAALIPDAAHNGIEVRPVMAADGAHG